MPLPLLLGIGAVIAGASGLGLGIHGGMKMSEAKDTMASAERRHKNNLAKFESENNDTTQLMDELGIRELEIFSKFSEFSKIIEQIKNKPEFKPYSKDGIDIPKYDAKALEDVSVGAGLLLGGIGGAALGTAGGFAASGITTAAVMALGTASTGTAISTLSGAAAANATLAALGGGSLAAGGGGIALGTTMLGLTTLGVGILVGGIIFNFTGSKLSDKADEAWNEMKKAEKNIENICKYLAELKDAARNFLDAIEAVNKKFLTYLTRLTDIVEFYKKTDYNQFSSDEKLVTENTVLLVSLLYKMGKVQLVLKSDDDDVPNKVNSVEVQNTINGAESFLANV
jgi:hypothetical protein